MTADQSPQASNKRQEEAAAWVLKNRDVNQSAHEARAFEEWVDSPENREAYEAAERLTGETGTAIKPRGNLTKILAIAILCAALAGGALILLRG
jgi:ferric-dicitrate binding protein FerR (iron transport regulator)